MAKAGKLNKFNLEQFGASVEERKARTVNVFFLIVSEGEKTEPNYFKKFNRKAGNVIFEINCEGTGYNTLSLVNEAIRIRDKNPTKYNRIWVVFDKDDFSDANFNNAIAKAKTNNISCAWSNEAFELWYLLHFHYRNTAMNRDEYKKAIEKELKKKNPNFIYKKNSATMYDILQEHGDENMAIRYAEKLSESYDNNQFSKHNPRTQVYELVRQLRGKDKILNKEIKDLF